MLAEFVGEFYIFDWLLLVVRGSMGSRHGQDGRATIHGQDARATLRGRDMVN